MRKKKATWGKCSAKELTAFDRDSANTKRNKSKLGASNSISMTS